jgi:flagellar protein FlaI
MLTRTVFKWDSATDHLYFRGNNNSFILENRIAAEHGYADKKDIYIELRKRERIIAKMAELNIVGYKEVVKIFGDYYEKGENSLPFNY